MESTSEVQGKTHLAETKPKTPRIKPIDKPSSPRLRLAYWLTRRELGKVITPMKVVQARMPYTLGLAWNMMRSEDKLSLPEDLIFYIKSYVASLNGCSFCVDIAKAQSDEKEAVDNFGQLGNFASSDSFTRSEKAALQYVDEATRNKEVSEKTFDELRRYYSEREIVEITWLNALENYYNLINRPLRIESDDLCRLPSSLS